MAKKLNKKAVTKIKSLINSNHIDFDSSWSFSDSKDGSKLLGPDGDNWERYSSVFLGINTDKTPNTKGYWSHPVGKLVGDQITVFRSGVIAAKNAAAGGRGAPKNEKILNAADDFLSMIDKKKDKCKKKDTVQRYDFFDEVIIDNPLAEQFILTDEGYLKGRAIVTNIGVFPYLMPDGSIRRELRHPDDVLDYDSLQTLKLKPLTNDHPLAEVGINNIKDVQAGSLGDKILHDHMHVSIPMIVTEKQAIQDILAGKRGLSCGYFARIEEESGNFLGTPYDVRQKDISYNHCAVVDQGRAGDAARIKLDHKQDIAYYIVGKTIKEDSNMSNLKKIVLDSVEYEAEETVIVTLNKYKSDSEDLKAKIDKQNGDIETLKAERDSFKEKNDQLTEELKSKNDTSVIDKAVEERLLLLKNANKADIEVKGDMKPIDIKKAIIVKKFPKADLEGKSDVYIEARYDAAIEEIDLAIDGKKREDFSEDFTDVKIDSEKSRQDMIDRTKKVSRGIKEE